MRKHNHRTPRLVCNPLRVLMPMSQPEIKRCLSHYWIAIDLIITGRADDEQLYIIIKLAELVYIATQKNPELFGDVPATQEHLSDLAMSIKRAADAYQHTLNEESISTARVLAQQVEHLFACNSAAVVQRWSDAQNESIRSGAFRSLNHQTAVT